MSAPIDVLAAIDLGRDALSRLPAADTLSGLTPQQAWDRMVATRAAVSELIDAAIAFGRETDGGMQPCGRDIAHRFAVAVVRCGEQA